MTYRQFTARRGREDFATIFDDFMSFRTADWTLTTTEAGTGAATEVASGGTGILTETNDDADNDLDAFQYAGGGGATVQNIRFVAGKKTQIVGRFNLSAPTATDFMFGAYVTDTDPIGGVTHGAYFRVVAGSAALTAVLENASTETVVDTGKVLAANTYVEVELYYNGEDMLVYVDNVRVAKMPLTNLPTGQDLALSFVVQNGSAGAKIGRIDYIGSAQER